MLKPDAACAQNALDGQQIIADSARYKLKPATLNLQQQLPKKHFGRAAALFGAAEVLPWVYDRYVAQKDYARISGKTVAYNLNPGHWAWDNDEFQTNQFGHPYHGSQFYSAFRANGYSFWQAVPAAFAGSYLWETFAENQAPAPNDFINTSFGGVVLGEMTYRLSNRVINNRARGFKRQLSEVAGLLINPMNGVTRILDGRWGRVRQNPAERDSSKISAEFDLGIRAYSASGSISANTKAGWFGRAKLIYGTTYENYKVPFSNIYVNVEFGKDDSSLVNNINVYGSIIGWELNNRERSKHLAVISANYDYIHNVAFSYGGQSVKLNLFSEYIVNKQLKFSTTVGTGPVLLAAVPDKYYFKGRSYDYNSGISLIGGAGMNVANRLFYSIDYRGAWLATVNGQATHYFLHVISSELRYRMASAFSIAAEPAYFVLKGYYRTHPDVISNYPYLRASVRYSIGM